MHRIVAVAVNTFREAVRDRVLYGVLGVASAVLVFTLVLAEVSLDQQRRIVLDVGLASISLFSVLVAIFLGSSLLYKEIERKTLYVILPKPIRRHEFLLGKYFGIALTALVFVALMGAVQLLVAAYQRAGPTGPWVGAVVAAAASLAVAMARVRDRTAALPPWSLGFLAVAAVVAGVAGVDLSTMLAQLTLVLGEVLVLAAVALLFSSFSTPFLTGLFTLGVWLVGRSADEMATTQSQFLTQGLKSFLHALARVVPNFNLFVPGRHALTTMAADGSAWAYVGTSMGYAVLYAAVVLALASLIFRRRDFL